MSTIERVKKKRNYSTIDNTCVRDSDLSFRAKGLFWYIMSLPDDWRIHRSELYTHGKEGRQAMDTAFKELQESGYIHKEPKREKDGTLRGWVYKVYEVPKADFTELPETRNTVNRRDGMGQVLSTDGISTDTTTSLKESSSKEPPQGPPKSGDDPEEEFTPSESEEPTWRDYETISEYMSECDSSQLVFTAEDFIDCWNERGIIPRTCRKAPKYLKAVRELAQALSRPVIFLAETHCWQVQMLEDKKFDFNYDPDRLLTWLDEYDFIEAKSMQYRAKQRKAEDYKRYNAFGNIEGDLAVKLAKRGHCFENKPLMTTSTQALCLLQAPNSNDFDKYHDAYFKLNKYEFLPYLEAYLTKYKPEYVERYRILLEESKRRNP